MSIQCRIFNLRRILVDQPRIILLLIICILSISDIVKSQILESGEKERILHKISELMRDKYVFPELGKNYEQEILSWIKSDKYGSIDSTKKFAGQLTDDLQNLATDKHISLRVIEPTNLDKEKTGSLRHPVRLSRLIKNENMGFYKFEWLEGNIAYLDIRRFNTPEIAKDMLTSAMNFASRSNAIIIDIRENQGGDTDLLPVFCSYFLKYPTQLNSDYFRIDDLTKENWTVEHIAGKRLTGTPLFILTSRTTFSAAESFAYDMQVNKRATIIGDSTRGGAHSVDLFKIDDRFEIYISTARSFNPVTGKNWEGIGVIPDVYVPAVLALDTAMVLAQKAAMKYSMVQDSEMKKAVSQMQYQLDLADSLYRTGQDKKAGVLIDSVFEIGLKVELIDEFFVQVLAYDYWSEEHQKILISILNKNITIFPKSPSAHDMLAWAHMDYGDKDQAIKYFKKVLQLDPDNSLAPEMIKKLEKN
jgi:retinol-binding protein 3